MTMALLAGTFTLVITLICIPLSMRLLRRAAVWDQPNARSSHTRPTLRGGGLAPACVALLTFAWVPGVNLGVRGALLTTAGGFAVVGLLEDFHGISTARRFLLHVAFATGGVLWLLGDLGNLGVPPPLFAIVGVLWLVAYANGFNFMDGINGMSAVQVMLAASGYLVLGAATGQVALIVPSAVLVAAGAAFLPFNFPRARVFLGDVGSYFFGACLGLVALLAWRGGTPLVAVVAPVSVYLADTGWTLAKRVWHRERWWEPHRDHAYQRLVRLGRSHAYATGLTACATIATISFGLLSLAGGVLAVLTLMGLLAVLTSYLALPALVVRGARRAPSIQ